VRTLDEAFRVSNALAHSTMIPRALQGKGPDILAVLLYGAELGLSVGQSLVGIRPIEGRPTMSTELREAKTRERGHRVSIVCATCGEYAEHPGHGQPTDRDPGRHPYQADWTAQRCTVRATRGDTGETAQVTWTIEDAIAAGLVKRLDDGTLRARSKEGKPLPWELYTRDMLYNRAVARACRMVAPEVGFGLYTEEETLDIAARERAEQAAQPRCPMCGQAGHDQVTCPQVQDAQVVDPDEARRQAADLAAELGLEANHA
jgi:hypothetical protein